MYIRGINTLFWLMLAIVTFVSMPLTAQESSSKTFTVGDFFTAPQIQYPSISPNGDYFIYKKFGAVYGGTMETDFEEIIPNIPKEYLLTIQWTGNNTFVAKKRDKRSGFTSFRFYKIAFDVSQNKIVNTEVEHLKHGGYIVDPVYSNEDRVIFAKYRKDDEVLYSDVYVLRLFGKKPNYLRKNKRINKNSGYILHWMTDKKSKLFMGVSYENNKPVLWIKNPKGRRFKEVWRATKESSFTPVALNADSTDLFVLTNALTDKMVAASFNMKSFKIEQTLYENEISDVEGVVLDQNTEQPIAAYVYRDGIQQYHFLDPQAEQKYSKIKALFPDERVYIADTARSEDFQIVITVSQTSLAKMHFCSVGAQKCREIESLYPWLEGVQLAKSETFSITTEDGLRIESYLTIPNTKAPHPLIVMPHGGPIGVRDNRYFSGHKQWLAHHGFAVLQVNYRGSGGFGQIFENSGLQQFGRGIEDDIENSLRHALEAFPQLNKEQICGFGSSYGGYSVLMGLIRNPDLYKCAVSFAGVTDLTLLFNKGSLKNSKRMTRSLIKMVGSPKTQMDELIANSPVYQYKKITKPVMLLHGVADEVVDVEHSLRLSLMLEKQGTPHEMIKFNRLTHGFERYEDLSRFYENVLPFLKLNIAGD